MSKYLKSIFLILPLILLISCGDEEITISTGSNSNVPLSINVDIPEEQQITEQDLTTAQLEQCLGFVSNVRVVVQGDFPTFSRLFSVGQRIVIFLPPGQVTVSVSLENNDGEVCCSGQETINLVEGVSNSVTITCEPISEICNNSEDDNGNGLIDCQESTCEGFPCDGATPNDVCIDSTCLTPPSTETDCDDGEDNDFDSGIENGGTDCEDIDCSSDPACIEIICDDGIDNEGDGLTDCDDLDCAEDEVCDEVCFGGVDEDTDGDIDCADDECNNQNCNENDEDFVCVEGVCQDTGGETDCDNGVDDDDDGLTDCNDLEDCVGRVCFDGDQGSACVIEQTEGGPVGECQEVVCDDGINNENDTIFQQQATDCLDEDCDGEVCGTGSGATCDFMNGDGSSCIETNCSDGIDNNLNESVDCEDFDCDGDACGTGSGAFCNFFGEGGECIESNCSDGIDNDEDGSIDGDDFDCFQITAKL